MELNLKVDQYCFACGTENPIGLKLKFEPTGDGVEAKFTPGKEHQGFVNLVHGGILSALMDEAMAHAVLSLRLKAVTARMGVSFKKPTRTGEPLAVKGRIIEKRGRIIKTAADISQNGTITAEATADFLLVSEV
ncbi:MAG: PaaI family thioesterase [Bacteroidota bacterium]